MLPIAFRYSLALAALAATVPLGAWDARFYLEISLPEDDAELEPFSFQPAIDGQSAVLATRIIRDGLRYPAAARIDSFGRVGPFFESPSTTGRIHFDPEGGVIYIQWDPDAGKSILERTILVDGELVVDFALEADFDARPGSNVLLTPQGILIREPDLGPGTIGFSRIGYDGEFQWSKELKIVDTENADAPIDFSTSVVRPQPDGSFVLIGEVEGSDDGNMDTQVFVRLDPDGEVYDLYPGEEELTALSLRASNSFSTVLRTTTTPEGDIVGRYPPGEQENTWLFYMRRDLQAGAVVQVGAPNGDQGIVVIDETVFMFDQLEPELPDDKSIVLGVTSVDFSGLTRLEDESVATKAQSWQPALTGGPQLSAAYSEQTVEIFKEDWKVLFPNGMKPNSSLTRFQRVRGEPHFEFGIGELLRFRSAMTFGQDDGRTDFTDLADMDVLVWAYDQLRQNRGPIESVFLTNGYREEIQAPKPGGGTSYSPAVTLSSPHGTGYRRDLEEWQRLFSGSVSNPRHPSANHYFVSSVGKRTDWGSTSSVSEILQAGSNARAVAVDKPPPLLDRPVITTGLLRRRSLNTTAVERELEAPRITVEAGNDGGITVTLEIDLESPSVEIAGKGFSGVTSVTYVGGPGPGDDVELEFEIVDDNTLRVIVPPGTPTGMVRVATPFNAAYRLFVGDSSFD